MTSINGQYDAAVIGGGPAGATLATLLQRQGHRCLILEATRFPRYHIGESLIPQTYHTLDRLGLLSKLRSSHFPKKFSVRFVSPNGEESQPFYFSETIEGERAQTWQVERSEFDQLCLDNAAENGVEVMMGAPVERVAFHGNRASGIVVRRDTGDLEEIPARVVVDASGRAALLGGQLGLRATVPGLNKASLWSYYRGGRRLPGIDAGETTVFTIADRGWFWYIPLPSDIVSVGIVASPIFLFAKAAHPQEVFLREVENCAPLWDRLRDAERIAPVRVIRRLAYRNRQFAGNGWVMIGDAAAFLDPIYSSGLFLALASAELAAECIHSGLQKGDISAPSLGAFVEPLTKGVDVVRRLIHAFYDPDFSFRQFTERFSHYRSTLIDCLIGDVIHKDYRGFVAALATMTPAPPPLG
jgi:flavin-dependent dehydrogenase